MRTPNYDIAYKINVCEEYYNRIASDSTITKIAIVITAMHIANDKAYSIIW